MSNATKIADLNDTFRKTMRGGKVVMTAAVALQPLEITQKVVEAIRVFDAFNEDNDPNGEHDFGAVRVGDKDYWFKIDYYDENCKMGSEDPTDPAKTTRVLTILYPEDY